MPQTLADILVAQGVDLQALQRAAARQLKLGGALDTALLELGLMAPGPLGDALAQAARLPRVSSELLTAVGRSVAPLFPKELAHKYGMVPLFLNRRQLSLLATHPVDLATIDEISFLLSRPLRLFVGLELEVRGLMRRVYGIELPTRLRELQAQLDAGEIQPVRPAAAADEGGRRESPPIFALDLDAALGRDGGAPGGALAPTATLANGAGRNPPKSSSFPPPAEPPADPASPEFSRAPTARLGNGEVTDRLGGIAEAEELTQRRALSDDAAPSLVAGPTSAGTTPATPEPPGFPAPSPAVILPLPPEALASSSTPAPSSPSLIRAAREWGPTPTAEQPTYEPTPSERPTPPFGLSPDPLAAPVAPDPGLHAPLEVPASGPLAAPSEPAGDPHGTAFWAEAGALLSGERPAGLPVGLLGTAPAPRAEAPASDSAFGPPSPVAPAETAAPGPASGPIAPGQSEPAPAGAASLAESPEPTAPSSPFEAVPITSGYAGRIGSERRLSAGEALVALREQPTRDGVMGVAIDFLRGAFDFVAIFVRRGETFQIFEASGVEYGGTADLGQTVVDLDRSRVLKMVAEGRAPYVGPVPAGDPLEGALGAVGRARLRAVLLYPVVIRDRTVAVVHGDRGGEALAPRQLADTALVLSQLGLQLERVLRERRKSGPPPAARQTTIELPALTVARLAAESVTHPDPSVPAGEAASPLSPAPEPFLAPPGSDQPQVAGGFEGPPAASSIGEALGDDLLALHAATLEDEEPFEVPIEWIDLDEDSGLAAQVRAFLSGDPPARARAAGELRAGGEAAGWALAERFPGPLFVFRTAIDELPAPEAMGPLLGLMSALGEGAIPALTELSESPSEERRFWATVLLAKLGSAKCITPLAQRLFDPAPDVALAARRGLWRLRKAPSFQAMLQTIGSELSTPDPERLAAVIRALGQFRHVAAIPRLVALVGIRDPSISQAANDALREITRQDFGQNERRWNAWWSEHQKKPRLQWLIEALDSRDRDLRLSVISELTDLTGLHFGYRSDLEPQKQGRALAEWREWWEREGKTREPAPVS